MQLLSRQLMHQRGRSAHPCLIAAPGIRFESSRPDRRSLQFACPAAGPDRGAERRFKRAAATRQVTPPRTSDSRTMPCGRYCGESQARRRPDQIVVTVRGYGAGQVAGQKAPGEISSLTEGQPGHRGSRVDRPAPCCRNRRLQAIPRTGAKKSRSGQPVSARAIRPPVERLRACLIPVSAWTGQHLQARPAHERSRRRAVEACSRRAQPPASRRRTSRPEISPRRAPALRLGDRAQSRLRSRLLRAGSRGFLICRIEGVAPMYVDAVDGMTSHNSANTAILPQRR